MTKYMVMEGSEEGFEERVEAALERGWRLQGGIAFTPSGEYAQAMTLTEKEETDAPDLP